MPYDKITTFRTVDEDKAVMWACNECWEKFVPISQLFAEVAAEREACAKVCDDIGNPWALDCAFTIRARGQE